MSRSVNWAQFFPTHLTAYQQAAIAICYFLFEFELWVKIDLQGMIEEKQYNGGVNVCKLLLLFFFFQ